MKKLWLETIDGTIIEFTKDKIRYVSLGKREWILTYDEFDRLLKQAKETSPSKS